MTRAYAILTMIILISTPLAGCLDEPVDDILGCMDENAVNYQDNATKNATSDFVDDCIYLASMESFISAMNTSGGGIEEMLTHSTRAGYSQTISTSGYDEDMGMDMDLTMIERVLVDMDRDAVLVQTSVSASPMVVIDYTHIQVGEVVNIHFSVGGMMAAQAGGAESGAYLVRDSTPNVMEIVHAMIDSDDSEDDMFAIDLSDMLTQETEIPEDAINEITYEADSNSHVITMSYFEGEDDMNMNVTVNLDESGDLISYSSHGSNETSSNSIEYIVIWDDAVVIEVDETLPRNSIPVHFDIGGEFVCDNGDIIPMIYFMDGWVNCLDGSDESFGGDEVVYICNSGEEISFSWINDGWGDCYDGSDEATYEGGEAYICGSGEEIPFSWINNGGEDCYDGSDEATYEEGEVGEPNFTDILDCWFYVDSSVVGDEDDPSELWDGTNLNLTECGYEASEYYTEYLIGDTPDTSPYSITSWDVVENWSIQTGLTGDFCVDWYDGSYDTDNDVCSIVYEMKRNDTHILYSDVNWADNNNDPDGEMCEEYEGSYDADEDICWFADAEIVDSDGEALVVNRGDGDEYLFYQYDSTTGSGVNIEFDSYFLCDNGELVESESFDNGYENCEDGSDELGQGEETSEFTCMDGTVIQLSGVNDGWEDCADGSDELGQGEETSEFTCMDADETVIPFSRVNDGWDNDCPDGSDEMWYYEDGDDADGGDSDFLPVITAFVADNQTLNAPVSDFEMHFLSDCDPIFNDQTGLEDMPNRNDCTVEFSIPLIGGETDDGVMLTYTDHDADGLVSPGDELTLDWGDYDGDAEPEVYDTWASEYSAESKVSLQPLPGFGALLAVIGMLGAVLIRVESRNDD
jgi:hypothetical protein